MRRENPETTALRSGRASTRSSPAVELRHLRYFLMVSEELHFGHAAERLHIAQPPLSQAIRKLEEELGVELFTRTSRAVALTAAGRTFAEEAHKVLVAFDVAVAEARRAGGSSTLRIGCTPLLSLDRLVRFLDGLHELDLPVRAEVRHVVGIEQIELLQSSELDLGIFAGGYPMPQLQSEALFAGESLAVFLTADDPLAQKPVLGPSDLAGKTLVSVAQAANPPLAVWLGNQMERAGYRFRGHREVGTHPRDWALAVAEGLGVALLPASLLEIGGADALVVRRALDPPLRMPDTFVVWRTRAPAQLRGLIREIRELARTLHEATPPDDLHFDLRTLSSEATRATLLVDEPHGFGRQRP